MGILIGNPHEERRQPEISEWNAKIAKKIEDILKTSPQACLRKHDKPPWMQSAMFSQFDETGAPVSSVELIKITDPYEESGYYAMQIPQDFDLPVFAFRDFPNPVTTPYGVLPDDVVSEGVLYSFDNYYFFNKSGKAVKYEGISPYFKHPPKDMSSEEILKLGQKELMAGMGKMAPVMDFPVDPKDSRFIPLSPGDREKIEGILHQIETGEFKEV